MTTKAMERRLQRIETGIRGPVIELPALVRALHDPEAAAEIDRRLARGASFGPHLDDLIRQVEERRASA